VASFGKYHVSTAVAQANAKAALSTGFFMSAAHRLVPLSSGLVSGKATSGNKAARSSASSAPSVGNGNSQANQDYGYYSTGNGQLVHNTESVAVDPLSAGHVVVVGTDTRAGSQGNNFNAGSNPGSTGVNAAACIANRISIYPYLPIPYLGCLLIGSLGGPGVYNSIDGAATFTDQIIPDMITGAVPNELLNVGGILPLSNTVPLTGFGNVGNNDLNFGTPTGVTCAPNGSYPFTPGLNVAGFPGDCIAYNSAGDQSAAFDAEGDAYTVSLGVLNAPTQGLGLTSNQQVLLGLPQTDIVINVSPALQPVGLGSPVQGLFNNQYGSHQFMQPLAAGRFFTAPPNSSFCNPFRSDTYLCLHNEVVVSNEPTNFIAASAVASTTVVTGTTLAPNSTQAITGTLVGRNWQADANVPSLGALGSGACGYFDVCLIDTPYLAIDELNGIAYITYTLIDFSTGQSNIYEVSSQTLGNPGTGQLPRWNPPIVVDNGFNNGFTSAGPNGSAGANTGDCTNLTGVTDASSNVFSSYCTSSWGAEPTVASGKLYIAYENADYSSTSMDGTPLNQVLVAYQYMGSSSQVYRNTQFFFNQEDHDAFYYAQSLLGPNGSFADFTVGAATASVNYAGLDPLSGAYFTIPNRPSIAVNAAGTIMVVSTDQRNAALGFTSGLLSYNRGTRVWATAKTVLTPPTSQPALDSGALVSDGEVYSQLGFVNQFFPWITASQVPGGTNAFYVGFYQETPGTPAFGTSQGFDTWTSTASLAFLAARSTDGGATFGVRSVVSGMVLPNPPADGNYVDALVGGSLAQLLSGIPYAQPTNADFSASNSYPYFGTYIGAASDNSNGAYLSFTNTLANNHDFGVAGSQNISVTHLY